MFGTEYSVHEMALYILDCVRALAVIMYFGEAFRKKYKFFRVVAMLFVSLGYVLLLTSFTIIIFNKGFLSHLTKPNWEYTYAQLVLLKLFNWIMGNARNLKRYRMTRNETIENGFSNL